jgi:hypothetical protein
MLNISRISIAIAILLCNAATSNAIAQAKYPLVFTSAKQLRQYGIDVADINDTGGGNFRFPHKCYYYGDGGWTVSISDNLLKLYKSRGFSRRSACMAILSGARFNPETGKRLASFILASPKFIQTGQVTDAGDLSDELPLSLPTCFKNATPYSDCNWKVDPISGVRLASKKTAEFKVLGKRIEKYLGSAKTRAAFHYGEESPFTRGMIMVGGVDDVGNAVHMPGQHRSDATFYDYSHEFPKGFGYALNTEGGAAPEVPPEVVKAAMNGSRKPRPYVDPNRLKFIVLTGAR